jgi:KH domain.
MRSDLASDIYEHRNAILPPHHCLLTCYIPPSRVGAVIGRKGSTILQIQKEATKKGWGQIRLSVVSKFTAEKGHHQDILENSSKDEGNEAFHLTNELDWTPVLIRGDPCGAFAAAKLLIPLLRDGPPGASEDLDLTLEMDDIVLEVPIHRAKHSLVIGKRGSTIAHLSAENNVRIMVPHRTVNKSSVGNINIIQLEGQLGNVERCLVKMLKLISIRSSVYNPDAGYSVQGKEVELMTVADKNNLITVKDTTKKELKFYEKTIMVPPELFPLVPSLARIRMIGRSTNTVIRRKKINEDKSVNHENPETDESSDDEKNDKHVTSSQKDGNHRTPCAIHFIISGKSRAVDNAMLQLQRILTTTVSETDDDKYHIVAKDQEEGMEGRYPRKSKGKGRYGRGSSKSKKTASS